MRIPILLMLLAGAAPASAQTRVSLLPFEGQLAFAPEAPRTLPADHPLYARVIVEPVREMPGRIGSILVPITTPNEFNAALRQTLASANMLAGPDTARTRLRVTWRRFDLPFRISISSRATVAVHYELSRIDTGEIIFAREIVTQADARGGDGSTRARGTGRAAILANIASLTLCLDKAAVQGAPADCALRSTGRFSAPITVMIPR